MNDENSMTAFTAEQMRALAEREEREAEHYAGGQTSGGVDPAEERYFELVEVAAALRDAAIRLDAATALIADVGSQRDYWADRAAAVERVADKAQDDEDGNGWVPIDPLLDALYPEKRGSL